MSNNLFLDTDVILDVVLDREKVYENSLEIFRLFENSKVKLFTTSSIIINAQYIGQKLIGKEKSRAIIRYLLNYLVILEPDINIIKIAYYSQFNDIEDAVQFFTAIKESKIDFFITRNTKDFKVAEYYLPVITPSEFLKRI